MAEIRKITLGKLDDFMNSDQYKNFENKPISPNRALSYLHNPHAQKEDIVLYLLYENEQLIAYRTLYRDVLYTNSKVESFGWLSGNWVHPDFRRKGYSTWLFNEAYTDWDGKVLFTNYAPESEKAYTQTGQFSILETLHGKRFYIRHNWSSILAPKNSFFRKNKKSLERMDDLLNKVSSIKISKKVELDKAIKIYDFDEINPFSVVDNSNSLFQKNTEDYTWWKEYPWIENTSNPTIEQKKYHFSSYSANYKRLIVEIESEENENSLFIIRIRDGHAKIPYYFCNENAQSLILNALQYCIQNYNITHLTSYSKIINQAIGKRYLNKSFHQHFYISSYFYNSLNLKPLKKIFSGDGDGIFT